MSTGSFFVGALVGSFVTVAAVVAFFTWACGGDW